MKQKLQKIIGFYISSRKIRGKAKKCFVSYRDFNTLSNRENICGINITSVFFFINDLFSFYLFPVSQCFLHLLIILEIWIKLKYILNFSWSWGDIAYEISLNDDCNMPRNEDSFQMSWYKTVEFLLIDLCKTTNNMIKCKKKKKEK